MPWISICKGKSGFAASSTAEDVTKGIDGTGLTAIVTGATSGIGLETARVLALRGVHVIMPARNIEAGEKVKERIADKIPNAKLEVMELDISSLESVRNFASQYCSKGYPLNILIWDVANGPTFLIFRVESLNAGIMTPPFTLSKDNIELQFATNHVGNFLLTNLLLETMKKTARESGKEGRIVILSSFFYHVTYKGGIRFDKINDEKSYSPLYAYGQSKLANLLHAKELGRRLQEEGVNITANAVHPGIISTNIARQGGFFSVFFNLSKHFLKNVPQGAATTCYIALHPQVNGVSGQYFADSNLSKASRYGVDAELAKKLWDFSSKLTNSN